MTKKAAPKTHANGVPMSYAFGPYGVDTLHQAEPVEGYRKTPKGELTVGDLVKPGAIVRTNYGTGPYRVVKVIRYEWSSPSGQVWPNWSLVMSDADAETTRRDSHSYINDLVAVGGRLLQLFANNTDEVTICQAASVRMKSSSTSCTASYADGLVDNPGSPLPPALLQKIRGLLAGRPINCTIRNGFLLRLAGAGGEIEFIRTEKRVTLHAVTKGPDGLDRSVTYSGDYLLRQHFDRVLDIAQDWVMANEAHIHQVARKRAATLQNGAWATLPKPLFASLVQALAAGPSGLSIDAAGNLGLAASDKASVLITDGGDHSAITSEVSARKQSSDEELSGARVSKIVRDWLALQEMPAGHSTVGIAASADRVGAEKAQQRLAALRAALEVKVPLFGNLLEAIEISRSPSYYDAAAINAGRDVPAPRRAVRPSLARAVGIQDVPQQLEFTFKPAQMQSRKVSLVPKRTTVVPPAHPTFLRHSSVGPGAVVAPGSRLLRTVAAATARQVFN